MKFESKDKRRPKVGETWFGMHLPIKVEIKDVTDDKVIFAPNDRESLEREYGKGSPEVDEMLGQEDSLPMDKFLFHWMHESNV